MTRGLILLPVFAFTAAGGAAQSLKVDTPLPTLETAVRRDSADAAAHYNLALGYWHKERWDRVETELRAALQIDSRFAPAYLALAYLPQASGKFWEEKVIVLGGGWRLHLYTAPDSVVQEYERLVRRATMIDPLVDIRIAVATEYRGGHIDRFDRALYAYNDSKWDEAHQRFGELVADSNDFRGEKGTVYERILWYHSLAAARLQKYDEAIADLGRLVDRSQRKEAGDTLIRWPMRTNEYRYALAFITQRAGNPNEAIQLYGKVLENDIGLYMAHVQVAGIYEGARMWDQAIQARRHAINANPEDPSLPLDLGMTLAKAGRWIDAEESLRLAQDANPRDSRVPYYLGIVQQQLAKPAEARAAFTRFLAIAPSRYERQIADAKQRLAALQ